MLLPQILDFSKLKEFADEYLNPFPNKPWFLRVCITSLLKTLWQKEELLVTSNFSFSRNVFYRLREHSAIFIKFEIVVCKLFQFGSVKNSSFGKRLNVMKMAETSPKEWKTLYGKGEIARYEQFLLFLVFSKYLYCRHIKTRACLGKG